MTSLMEN